MKIPSLHHLRGLFHVIPACTYGAESRHAGRTVLGLVPAPYILQTSAFQHFLLFVDLNLLSLNSLSPRFPKGRHLVCRIPSSSTRLLPSNPSPCGSLDNLWPALGTPHHSSLSDFVDIVDKRISDVCTLHRGRGERNHAQDCIQVSYDQYQYSRAVTHGVGL